MYDQRIWFYGKYNRRLNSWIVDVVLSILDEFHDKMSFLFIEIFREFLQCTVEVPIFFVPGLFSPSIFKTS